MIPRHVSIARAFTLLELLIAVIIIGILAALMFPAFAALRARAQRIQCTSNLRNLYIAADLFLQRNGSWPQIRMQGDSENAQRDYANAWIAALAPFGPTQQTWICPTMQGLLGNPDLSKPENTRVDYFATPFDDKPTTPHEWPRQPWFLESGLGHGHGTLIMFTDGSVSDVQTVIKSPAP